MLWLPGFLTDVLACGLTIYTTADTVRSFQAAMDLREVLTRLTEENEDLRRLARRVEVMSAFAEDDLRRFRERTEVNRLLRQERREDAFRRVQDAKLTALANLRESLESYRARLEAARDLTGEALEARLAETEKLLEQLRDREAAIRTRTARRYRQALRILRGNPSATAKSFAEALESLRKLGECREDGEE